MNSPAIQLTPYAGVTLTNLTAVGRYLGLASAFYDPISAGGGAWTYATGATADQGMTRLDAPAGVTATINGSGIVVPAAGDLDYCFRYDVTQGIMDTAGTTGYAIRSQWNDGTNQVAVRLNADGGSSLTNFKAEMTQAGGTLVGSLSGVGRFGFLRTRRVGNIWTTYYGDPLLFTWNQIAQSGALAYGTASSVNITSINTTGTGVNKAYVADWYSLRATSTSGTAQWQQDTVRGLRGMNVVYLPGATGSTVTVQYRVAPTKAGLAAASFTTWTNGNFLTPDPAVNRWVEVKITVAVLATGDQTPLIAPPTLFYEEDANPISDLARVYVSSFVRHTRADGLVSVNGAPTAGNVGDYWVGISGGLADYINAGNSATAYACDGGTTVNLVTTWAASVAQFFVDASTATNAPLNGGRAVLKAILLCPTLYAALSGACKSNMQTKIPAATVTAININAMRMLDREMMNKLAALYPGDGWPTFTTGQLDTDWTILEAAYLGDGWYNDASGTATHFDTYSSVIGSVLSDFADIGSTYRQTEIAARVQACAAAQLDTVDKLGNPTQTGRSVNSSSWSRAGDSIANLGVHGLPNADAYRRDYNTRGYSSRLQREECLAFGITPSLLDRQGSAGALDSYTTFGSNTFTGWLGEYADITQEPDRFNVPSLPYPRLSGSYYAAHPSIGSAFFRGPGANDPKIELWTRPYDTSTTDNNIGKYAARVHLTKHAQNVGAVNSGPSLLNGTWFYRDSALSANNLCFPLAPTTGLSFVVGRGVGVWRRASLKEYSGTVAGTAVPTTVLTESLLGWGAHIFSGAYLNLGARTSTVFRYGSPPSPIPNGGAALNQATGTDWAYQECPADLGSAGQFVRNLSPGTGTPLPAVNNLPSGTDAQALNRLRYSGRGIAAIAAVGTGNQFGAVHQVFSDAAFTPATYATYLTGYAQAGKHHSFQDGDGGIAYVSGDPGTEVNPTVGSWSLTGNNVMGFRGKAAAADWAGGSDLTDIAFSGVSQISCSVAGNIAFDKLDAATTRVWARASGNVTLKGPACPSGANQVFAYDLLGNQIDVTSQCSTNGTDWTIPSTVVTAYTSVGVPYFDVVKGTAGPTTVNLEISLVADQAVFTDPGSVTLTATVSGDNPISKVEFFKEGGLVLSDTLSPYVYTEAYTGANNGTHVYFARVTDSLGNTKDSSSLTISVVISPTLAQADIDSIAAAVKTSLSPDLTLIEQYTDTVEAQNTTLQSYTDTLKSSAATIEDKVTSLQNTGVGVSITQDTMNAIADTILTRDWLAVTTPAPARCALNALRFLRNAWSIVAGVLHVKKENDVDDAWTIPVNTTTGATPVTGIGPTAP